MTDEPEAADVDGENVTPVGHAPAEPTDVVVDPFPGAMAPEHAAAADTDEKPKRKPAAKKPTVKKAEK